MSETKSPPDHARCIDCGYLLRGLTSNRCPECGRAFDPSAPDTMNLGQRRERIVRSLTATARWLLAPVGWPMFVFAGLILISLWYVTGFPTFNVPPDAVDVDPYTSIPASIKQFPNLSLNERIYAITLYAIALLLGFWLLRLIARFLIAFFFSGSVARAAFDSRRQLAMLLGFVLMAAFVFYGWPYRIGMAIIDEERITPEGCDSCRQRYQLGPELFGILTSRLLNSSSPRDRIAGLRILIDKPQTAFGLLADFLHREKDPTVAAAALRLVGIYSKALIRPDIDEYLAAPDPRLRTAAADAMGLRYRLLAPFPESPVMATDPPIAIASLLTAPSIRDLGSWNSPLLDLPPARRAALINMMLTGPTQDEREAAARATVNATPPGYKLRIAEWGVWVSEAQSPALVQSLLDEIPRFVHRTGNAIDSFKDRVPPPPPSPSSYIGTFKPIIHITADQPLSVDLAVHILAGRPSVAYPMPDDFSFVSNGAWTGWGAGPTPALGAQLPPNDPTLPILKDLRGPLPWLLRSSPPVNGQVLAAGVRWYSLIVSPTLLPWMTPSPVSSDPKFQWWQHLRSVNSSWIASRGEAERFLYYDGPTLAGPPVTVFLKGDRLNFTRRDMAPAGSSIPINPSGFVKFRTRASGPPPQGLFIRQRGGIFQAWHMSLLEIPAAVDLEERNALSRQQTTQEFSSILAAGGLTAEESAGMIDSWRERFFETDGQRFLLFLTGDEYDRLCPLSVNPAATTLVRIGIVLTEFSRQ